MGSGSDGGQVALLDGRSGELLAVTSVPGARDLAVGGFQPDGSILIATSSGWLGTWDPDVGRSLTFACRVAGRDLSTAEWNEVLPDRDWQSTCPK